MRATLDLMVTGLAVMMLAPTVSAQQPALTPDAGRVVRDSRGGGGRAMSIKSAILGETRRINVALPASFVASAPSRKYPVTIVLDGESSLPAIAAVADELTRNGQIPESIIVAIENTDRLRDLTPPGLSVSGSTTHEGGDRFLDFIEKELLPAVDRQFRGAAPRILVGHSSGGILATYAAATRATYCCVVALDTPTHLGDDWLALKLIERARNPGRPIRYASYEARFGWSDRNWGALVAAAPPTWLLHHEKLVQESHESMPMLGMYLGLRQVFADYSMLAAPEAPTTSILPYYAKVATSLGADVLPPRKLLVNTIEDLLMEGRGAEARRAFDTEVAGYGTPADATKVSAEIADALRRPPPTETVESLLATPFPTPDEARDYIGTWEGDVWLNNDVPAAGKPRQLLRIRVVDGKVVGESDDEPAPGVKLVMPWTYMKVTREGMTYGYMNGMRPRGMLMHAGTLRSGLLTGVSHFGGISFKYPDGMTPPVIHFAFRKVVSKGQ